MVRNVPEGRYNKKKYLKKTFSRCLRTRFSGKRQTSQQQPATRPACRASSHAKRLRNTIHTTAVPQAGRRLLPPLLKPRGPTRVLDARRLCTVSTDDSRKRQRLPQNGKLKMLMFQHYTSRKDREVSPHTNEIPPCFRRNCRGDRASRIDVGRSRFDSEASGCFTRI